MKLLLDENLPKRLKANLTEFDVYTVRDKGWNGKKNGELLKLMLADNSYLTLSALVPKIKLVLSKPLSVGATEVK